MDAHQDLESKKSVLPPKTVPVGLIVRSLAEKFLGQQGSLFSSIAILLMFWYWRLWA